MVEHEKQQQHLWMMNPTKVVKTWLKKIILSTFAMVIKTYNIQLLENLIYLELHPPKHEKLHSCENVHRMKICYLHIDQ
jgi:hypothetical protein